MSEPEHPTSRDEAADLDDLLSRLSTLELVQVFLDRLADDIPVPQAGTDDKTVLMSLLGQRAKGLYANFVYSLGSPAAFAPLLAIRPLVELAILTKWMSLDPDLHGFLAEADSGASELLHMKAVVEHAKDRGHQIPESVSGATTHKEAVRDAALAKLKELGKNYGKDRIMPNVRRMADEVISSIPGHKGVMNDAYVFAYKTFSPWEHTEQSSFTANAKVTAPNDWEWLGDKSPWPPEDIAAIAGGMFTYIAETVFVTTGDVERAVMARKLRDHIVTQHVSPGRVQPPTDNPAISVGVDTAE